VQLLILSVGDNPLERLSRYSRFTRLASGHQGPQTNSISSGSKIATGKAISSIWLALPLTPWKLRGIVEAPVCNLIARSATLAATRYLEGDLNTEDWENIRRIVADATTIEVS
jgi:hypothetical protein